MGNQRFSIAPAKAAKDADLPDTVYRTLAILGIYGDENGWCWPSLSTIAEIRNMTPQAISKHIAILKERGYLHVQPRFREDGGRTSNQYQIIFDYPPSTSEVEGVSTPEVEGLSTSEVEVTTHNNDPKEKDNSPAGETQNDIRKRAEQYFTRRTGIKPLEGDTKRIKSQNAARWYAPLRTFCETGEWDPKKIQALMDECFNILDKDMIFAPQSLINTLPKAQANLNGHGAAPTEVQAYGGAEFVDYSRKGSS